MAQGRRVTRHVEPQDPGLEGFVVNHGGEVRAWINRCPHVGTPLDRWPNEFYTHGALYEPVSGSCTAGPCAGDALTPLPLRRDGDLLVVTCR